MAEQELSTALKEVLESRGVLDEIQARLRAEVYKALQDESVPKPDLCQENLLINELIREYLQFNHYKYTDSVLVAESGQQKEPLEREFLAKQLQLPDTNAKMPLLYHMLAHFMQQSPRISNQLPSEENIMQGNDEIAFHAKHSDRHCVIEEPLFPDS